MNGLNVNKSGWFNDENIYYRYRARPLNSVWGLAVARSRWLINEIEQHDWLRRRAGSLHDGFRLNIKKILRNYSNKKRFISVKADVTMNSRVLLLDLIDLTECRHKLQVCNVSKIID